VATKVRRAPISWFKVAIAGFDKALARQIDHLKHFPFFFLKVDFFLQGRRKEEVLDFSAPPSRWFLRADRFPL
jgi:hypothetical protein